MQPRQSQRPIEKLIVLVGAGNAHVGFVKRWSMRPVPGAAVTLVNQAPTIPYSAMIPGHLGGDYAWDEVTIDLVRLCSWAGVRLVVGTVTALDPARREVRFADRVPLSYDVLSLGVGSVPATPGVQRDDASLTLRPMAELRRHVEALEERLRGSPGPCHLAVVGGGASGCELALALHRRLSRHDGFRLTLLHGGDRLLPEFPVRAARLMQQAMDGRIAVRLDARVIEAEGSSLVLATGERVPFDAVLWATNAAPPTVLRDSGLSLDDGGFLRVRRTLQSVSDPAVFGTGDCVSIEAYPGLPKNGVYAVRQGAVLFDNVEAVLRERPLRPFRPQRVWLSLMNTSDGDALLSYGSFALKARWARWLKNRIDRAWIAKFVPPPFTPLPEGQEEHLMRCGGCAAKVPGDVLSGALRRLDVLDDPRVLVGCRGGDDAAVFQTDVESKVEVQTVDYFKSFLDDPYLFGRIAALHAVSDLYAMNAKPFAALAIATLPHARGPVQEATLRELLAGAAEEFRKLGVVLAGGHTSEGSDLAIGFAMTGHGTKGQLFRKGGLRPGDDLVLTKPLGSGALLAAWMRGQCRAQWFEKLLRSLLIANDGAAEVFREAGVVACTDITGFGLGGHLLEMLDASDVSATLGAAPLHDGFAEVTAQGILSTLQRDNAKLSCRVEGTAPAWLFDPQTSGGLLAGVRPEATTEVLSKLRQRGLETAAVIGRIVAADEAIVIRLGSV